MFTPQHPHILPKPTENISPVIDRPAESWVCATNVSFICWTLLWLTYSLLPRPNTMVLQGPLTDLAPLKALPKHLTKNNLYYLCASVRHFHCNYLVPIANISVIRWPVLFSTPLTRCLLSTYPEDMYVQKACYCIHSINTGLTKDKRPLSFSTLEWLPCLLNMFSTKLMRCPFQTLNWALSTHSKAK